MNKVYKTIIIDDEPPARIRLLKLLESFSDTFDVIEIAVNGADAKEKINRLKPDLIFLDIEMPELTGFELLEQLEVIPIVIFCTAYDQYSLKAFETNSVDYLLKPIKIERLEQSVDKLKLFSDNSITQNVIELLTELSSQKKEKKMTSITVKKGESLLFIKLDEVSHFKADERYVSVHTANESYLTEEPLSTLESKLPDNFLRIHRGIIINIDYIKEIQKYFNSRFVVILNNETLTKVTSGRSYAMAIKEFMGVS